MLPGRIIGVTPKTEGLVSGMSQPIPNGESMRTVLHGMIGRPFAVTPEVIAAQVPDCVSVAAAGTLYREVTVTRWRYNVLFRLPLETLGLAIHAVTSFPLLLSITCIIISYYTTKTVILSIGKLDKSPKTGVLGEILTFTQYRCFCGYTKTFCVARGRVFCVLGILGYLQARKTRPRAGWFI